MSKKDLSQALSNFADILVEQELEPIRLDLIRLENDFKDAIVQIEETVGNGLKETAVEIQNDFTSSLDEIKQKTENDIKEAVAELQRELEEITAATKEEKESQASPSVSDEKYYILKDAIENLAVKVSEALAEGLSEQEEHYTEICGKLESKISTLDKKLAQTGSESLENLSGRILEIEKKFEETASDDKFEELGKRVSKIEEKFKNLAELTAE